MGWIGCVRCKKFQRDFVARTFTLVRLVAPNSVMQPNGPKCPQIKRNVPKHQFRVHWGGSRAFVKKNSDATSCHELLHQFDPFCTESRKETKRSHMHPNITKHTKTSVLVRWGGSGAFVAKNSDACSWHELLH